MNLGKLLAKAAQWVLSHPEVVKTVTAVILERKKPERAK